MAHWHCHYYVFCYFHIVDVFLASRGSSLCRVAAVKHLPVHHHSVVYIFSGPLGSLDSFWVFFENGSSADAGARSVGSVAPLHYYT